MRKLIIPLFFLILLSSFAIAEPIMFNDSDTRFPPPTVHLRLDNDCTDEQGEQDCSSNGTFVTDTPFASGIGYSINVTTTQQVDTNFQNMAVGGNWTISFWVKIYALVDFGAIAGGGVNGVTNSLWYWRDADKFYVSSYQGGNNPKVGGGNMDAGDWLLMTLVSNGTTENNLAWFVNGTNAGLTSKASATTGVVQFPNDWYIMGDATHNLGGTSGLISEVLIWNDTALNTSQIEILWNGSYEVETPDTIPPLWTEIPSNITLEYFYDPFPEVDFNATDETQLSIYWSNDTLNFLTFNDTGIIINNTLLEVGTYILNVSVNDSSDNRNYSIWKSLIQDTIPPSIDDISPDQTLEYFTDVMFADINASDVSGLNTTPYSINDSNFNISVEGNIMNATLLAIGTYKINVTASDPYNNLNSTILSVTVQDSTPPTLSVNYPVNRTHYSDYSGWVNITISEPTHTNCTINDTNWTLDVNTTTNWAWLNNTLIPDGTYGLNISCLDSSGNYNEINPYFIFDSTSVSLNWITPSSNTVTPSENYSINATISDTYLDAVNFTIYNQSGAIVYTNFTDYNGTGITYAEQRDIINFTTLSGEGNYTLEICGRDSTSDSPDMPNYYATSTSDKIEFYDGDSNNNISVTFEMYNPPDLQVGSLGTNQLTLESKSVIMTKIEDGKHITYGATAQFNSSKEVGRFVYHSNNKNIQFIEKYIKPAHFITSDYSLYFHHESLTNKGWTIVSSGLLPNGDYEVYFTKSNSGYLDADPISGGLSQTCLNSSNLTYNIAPSINQIKLNTSLNLNRSNENISCYLNASDTLVGSLIAYYSVYNDSSLIYQDQKSLIGDQNFTLITTINSSYLDYKGQNITCGIILQDDVQNSSQVNETLTILNSPPTTPTIIYPTDGANLSQAIPINLSWTSTDTDGDTISYWLYLDTDSSLDLTQENSVNYYSISNPSTQATYYWKVMAGDGEDNSSNTSLLSFRNYVQTSSGGGGGGGGGVSTSPVVENISIEVIGEELFYDSEEPIEINVRISKKDEPYDPPEAYANILDVNGVLLEKHNLEKIDTGFYLFSKKLPLGEYTIGFVAKGSVGETIINIEVIEDDFSLKRLIYNKDDTINLVMLISIIIIFALILIALLLIIIFSK